jgi:hypothetical protein
MVEDSPEPIEPSPESGRAKRAPPTIDLEASEVKDETRKVDADPAAAPEAEPEKPGSRRSGPAILTVLAAAASGAVAAALVIGVASLLGWPGEAAPPPPQAAPSVNSAALDDLAARLASVENKTSKPPAPAATAPDTATVARLDALDKSVTALRGDLTGLRAQSEKLAADVGAVQSAPREAATAPDLTAIDERIAGLERAARAQSAAIAQESTKPADDAPLRRVVAATLLDVLVRVGDPYPAALAAAKSLAANPDDLKPLEPFAATGVPNPAVLCRDLLALVPKLTPPMEAPTTGNSLVDRLQAGAAKLVRIERTDAVGSDRGNVVARVTAAALRNDVNEARRELNTLEPADRAAAQAWIERADERDAALAVSRKFAAEAMTALARPAR